jgi:Lon protease-like protein
MSEAAIFPLNTVLFPGGPLKLRIFETRYVDMVRRCTHESCPFGVVLIRAGGEVGAVTQTAEMGTTARIVDFSSLPDGLLGITCVGVQRFRILRRWQQDDGLNLGEISIVPAEARRAVPEQFRYLSEALRRVLPELGALYSGLPEDFDDATWIGYRLAEILPLSLSDKQHCLELDEPLARLARLSPLIRRTVDP